MASVWTDERISELTRLYAEDYSASLIADALGGVSRQAVLAKVHRMGLPRRGEGRHPTRELNYSGQRKTPPNVARKVGPPPPRVPKADEIKLRCVEIVPRNLSLMDLEKGDCRYPYGDDTITFCGHPKMEGSSYCVPHFHLCRQEVKQVAAKARIYHGTDFAA